MNQTVMNITDEEIIRLISTESEKFKKNASKKILGKKIADISFKVLSKINKTLENNDVISVIQNHFNSSVVNFLKPGLVKTLENGGIGSNFSEELGSIIHKYVAQESYFRSNELKKKYGLMSKSLPRKEVLADVIKTFESDDLQLELSESFNEEYNNLLNSQENDIIDESVKQVSDSIAEAEQKAEVTRVIMNEFKEVSEKAKAEQDAMKPEEDPKPSTESVTFNSTEFIKSKIPISIERFKLEAENGSFTKKNIISMLLTLEENGTDYIADKQYINKRIEAIYGDTVNVKDFDVSKLDNFKATVDEAIKDVDATFSAFRMIGFKGEDLPAFKTDEDTLNTIKKMSELKSTDKEKRINDIQILVVGNALPITSAELFLNTALETFTLKLAGTDEITDYDSYKKATEIREDLISEFLVDGMQHIPAARAERLKEINSGLKKIATNDTYDQYTPKRMKSIFYKTAQIVDPGIFVDFKQEADRVKQIVAETYNTKEYDSIVDDFFNENYRKSSQSSMVSEENLYELSAYKAALDISTESDISSDINRNKVKAYATIFSCYFKTLESLFVVDKSVIKDYAKSISKK